MMKREFQNYKLSFMAITKKIKNMSDYIADLENLKRNVNQTQKDVEEIKNFLPRIFLYRSGSQGSGKRS
jgi:CII-binding regulator of phage lambda lysogenization HflD